MKGILCTLTATALAALGVSASSGAAQGASPKVPGYIKAAVAEPTRPQADRDRDADRKPELVILFAGIKPGDQVGELMPGGGYFTRIFCRVVGPSGHVYAVSIKPAVTLPPRPASDAPPNPCTNITADSQSATDLSLPSGLDVVWTSENYHDLHNKMFGPADMKQFDLAVFNALKPGGVFIVEDHMAGVASGARDTETLHRIDPELVKREVIAAGFKLVRQSDVLRRTDDPHTAKVFELKGKTDKFLFKFQKPVS
jgi:predicted methyltransferase